MTKREGLDVSPSRQPLPPAAAGEVFDLGQHHELVRRTFYAAHAARLSAAGLDVDDVYQRLCVSLLRRSAGPNPHDPSRGASVSGWIRMVCRSVASNALDQVRRRQQREVIGAERDAACSESGSRRPDIESLLDAREEISTALQRAGANIGDRPTPDGAASQIPSNPLTRKRPRAVRDRYLAVMVTTPTAIRSTDALPIGMSPSRAGLTPQQGQLALYMAAGMTADQAAAQLGVSSATVFRWLAAPGVREFVAELGDRLFAENAARLSQALAEAQTEAIDCLRRAVAEHGTAAGGIAAARALLLAAPRTREG